ncbi:hypothetical protein PHMEG_00025081 [Phytophthora megakarya]|uniref:Uncharacterized protein n=1 Tax=Phytophthora megakarya TaxID=4795 RepID=A0A225VCX4_9STRA|nr:hypothetical protein PHMEG_00025081 [Phytophthora megakarya]
MVCRRLSEPSQLITVASKFVRSCGAYSRILKTTISVLYEKHSDILYFKIALVKGRITEYCDAINSAGSLFDCCWGFSDGTKQYISC